MKLDLEAIEEHYEARKNDGSGGMLLLEEKIPALISEIRRLREVLGRAGAVLENSDEALRNDDEELQGQARQVAREIDKLLDTPQEG